VVRITAVFRLDHITFACDEPGLVAQFWAELLDGYTAEPSGQTYFVRGDGPELFFNKMKKSPTIEMPIHLDVNVPDRETELQRLLGLGARLVETKSHSIGEVSEIWTVMRDPEGRVLHPDTPERASGALHRQRDVFMCRAGPARPLLGRSARLAGRADR
jgi:hypothetical protein